MTPPSTTDLAGPKTLQVATYNIRKAIGRDYRRNPDRILEAVTALDADIVALQEADYRFKQRRAIFHPSQILQDTNMHVVPFEHDQPGLGWHGNVLLVSHRLRLIDKKIITLPGLEPRGALFTDLDWQVDGRSRHIRVICAHLGLIAAYRRRQARALLDAADPDSGRFTLILGDFNCWGQDRWSLDPFRHRMHEADYGKSFPSRRPVVALDRIFYSGPGELQSCGAVQTGLTRIASDHLPVIASFEIGDESAQTSDRLILERMR